jgi:hypothetical protein
MPVHIWRVSSAAPAPRDAHEAPALLDAAARVAREALAVLCAQPAP